MSPLSCHRITSYNVLSSCLAEPSHFTSCNATYLEKDYRLNKLLEKLLPEISMQAVINLQEVSNEWAGRLSAFFSQHQYHFFTALYGREFNGFMGVGVAVPIAKYDILDVDICTIGTTLPLPKKEEPNMLTSLYEKCFGPAPDCSWEVAKKRSNRMVSVVLQPRDEASKRGLRSASKKKVIEAKFSLVYVIIRDFCFHFVRYILLLSPLSLSLSIIQVVASDSTFSVSCYHMPCAFRDPPLMVIHCALAAQRAQWVADKAVKGRRVPYVLAGTLIFSCQG